MLNELGVNPADKSTQTQDKLASFENKFSEFLRQEVEEGLDAIEKNRIKIAELTGVELSALDIIALGFMLDG